MTNPTTSTRERILHQGLALMSEAGLSGVTLGVLADQVGMSKRGPFAHFRSKEDVEVELLTHMAEFVMEHVVRPWMTVGEGLLACGRWFAIGSDRRSGPGCREDVRWRPVCSSSMTQKAVS